MSRALGVVSGRMWTRRQFEHRDNRQCQLDGELGRVNPLEIDKYGRVDDSARVAPLRHGVPDPNRPARRGPSGGSAGGLLMGAVPQSVVPKTNMTGGHGGRSGRYERLRETAFRYAFIPDQVGLAAETPPSTAPR